MEHIITHLIYHGIENEHQIKAIAMLIMDSNYDSSVKNAAEELASMKVEEIKNLVQLSQSTNNHAGPLEFQ